MNNEVLHLQVNNVICEGYGCIEEAISKINVKVGQLGSISLDLCKDCTKKFDENYNSNGNSDVKQKIVKKEHDSRIEKESIEQ